MYGSCCGCCTLAGVYTTCGVGLVAAELKGGLGVAGDCAYGSEVGHGADTYTGLL